MKKKNKKDKVKDSVTYLLKKIEDKMMYGSKTNSEEFHAAFKIALDGNTNPLNLFLKNQPPQEIIVVTGDKGGELLADALKYSYNKKPNNEQEEVNQKN